MVRIRINPEMQDSSSNIRNAQKKKPCEIIVLIKNKNIFDRTEKSNYTWVVK